MSERGGVDERALVREVAARAGMDRDEDARHAILATLGALAERLDDGEVRVLAGVLPQPLDVAVRARVYRGAFGIDELYDRVARAESVNLGFAREHADSVLRTLGDLLPDEALERIRRSLPPEIAERFAEPARDEPAPPPYHVADSERHHTLATGHAGSRHPIAEAAPKAAHTHSVGERNPHGDRKLSSATGLTQEREEESLATARPDASRRISNRKD